MLQLCGISLLIFAVLNAVHERLFKLEIGEENGSPLQYSCLKNSMDRGQSMGSQGVGHD